MFSEKAKIHADACRFCWMCRHICPVGLVSGKEGNTPRGRALIVSMDSRNIPLTADAAALMYECCLCNACANDCKTGYDPTVFTREARTMAVVNGLVPPEVEKVIDRAMQGSLYAGEPDSSLRAAIERLPEKADTLVYLGDVTLHQSPEMALDLFKVLKAAGVEFTVLRDERASGAHLGDLIGYVDEVRLMSAACAQRMQETGAKKIVVLDPSDARFIKQQWGAWDLLQPDVQVITATSYVAKLLDSGRLRLRQLPYQSATFHDPCRLARDLDETEPARRIINAMGIPLREMFLNRKLTKCCSGAIIHQTDPALSKKIAAGRWEDAAATGADLLITACPGCRSVLGSQAPKGKLVRDIFSLLAEAC